jgi:general secretion pathway protein B
VAPKPVVQTPGVAAQVPAKGKPDPVAKAVKRQASAPTAPASQAIAKASAAPVAAPTVPLLSELPEDIRRQVPALTITGAVYSETPGQRLLLVNNQVLAEGSVITPELILEEIRAKSSIFNFRGTRFRLAH